MALPPVIMPRLATVDGIALLRAGPRCCGRRTRRELLRVEPDAPLSVEVVERPLTTIITQELPVYAQLWTSLTTPQKKALKAVILERRGPAASRAPGAQRRPRDRDGIRGSAGCVARATPDQAHFLESRAGQYQAPCSRMIPANARSASFTALAFGNTAATSGSSFTTFSLAAKRSA